MPAKIPGVKRNKHGQILCKCGKQLYKCKECDGRCLCKHGRQPSICKECGGTGICKHNKRRTRCPSCSPSIVYKQYCHDAERRKYEFSLSFKEYLKISDSPCIYCGDQKVRNGIDRKDNLIGYTLKNSVSCCSRCNKMKFTYSVEEFLAHAKRIASFQLKGENKSK